MSRSEQVECDICGKIGPPPKYTRSITLTSQVHKTKGGNPKKIGSFVFTSTKDGHSSYRTRDMCASCAGKLGTAIRNKIKEIQSP